MILFSSEIFVVLLLWLRHLLVTLLTAIVLNYGKYYCENLYASQEETKDTPEKFLPCGDDEPDILLSEVQEAIKKLKNQKAPGIDDIPGELLKQADDSVAIVLQKLCNSVRKSKIWPEDWKKSVFLTLPKKGDATECKKPPYHCFDSTCK